MFRNFGRLGIEFSFINNRVLLATALSSRAKLSLDNSKRKVIDEDAEI